MRDRYFIHKDVLPKNNCIYISSDTPLVDDKFLDVEDVFIHSDDCPHSPYYEGLSAFYMKKDLFNSSSMYSCNNGAFTDHTSARGLVYKGQIVSRKNVSSALSTSTNKMYILKLTRDSTGQYISLTRYSRGLQDADRNRETIKVSYKKGADLTTEKSEHYIVTDGQFKLLLQLGAAGGGGGGSNSADSGGGGGGASLFCLLDLDPNAEVYIVVGCNGNNNETDHDYRAAKGAKGYDGACSAICNSRDDLIYENTSNIILDGGKGGSLSTGGKGGSGYWGDTTLDNYINQNLVINSSNMSVGILQYQAGGSGGKPGNAGSAVQGGSYYLLSTGGGGSTKITVNNQSGGKAQEDGGGGGGASLFGTGGNISNDLTGGAGSYSAGGSGRNQNRIAGGRLGTVGGAGWYALYK